jgi:hypothetical protein
MLCEISLFVPSGTALAIDGETGELNRKFFATEVSNMYAKSKCDADQVQTPQLTPHPLAPGPSTSAMPSASLFAQALQAESEQYFSNLNEAQSRPETKYHFFWRAATPSHPHPPSRAPRVLCRPDHPRPSRPLAGT